MSTTHTIMEEQLEHSHLEVVTAQDASMRAPTALSVSTNVSSHQRAQFPSYRAVLPPQQSKALPLTPAPGFSPASNGLSPDSNSASPGCPPHLFSPSTPPMSAVTPTAKSNRRRKTRAPAYLPLDAYPQYQTISPAFATGQRTPNASSGYLPMSGTLPSSTPSLLSPTETVICSQATSPRTPAYQAAGRRSSLAPANSRPADQSHSQVCSPFSATTTPGFPFSPVPLTAVSITGRPSGYQQLQDAQSFTPAQRAAQEALDADEARKGSIGGLLAAAASTLSITSPLREASPTAATTTDGPTAGKSLFQTILSPASSWSTTSSGNGGWGFVGAAAGLAAQSGPILPGGDSNSGVSSRRTSFGDLSAPLMSNGSLGSGEYTLAAGAPLLAGHSSAVPRRDGAAGMMGFVSGVGKKLGSVEQDVWRWARGKPRSILG